VTASVTQSSSATITPSSTQSRIAIAERLVDRVRVADADAEPLPHDIHDLESNTDAVAHAEPVKQSDDYAEFYCLCEPDTDVQRHAYTELNPELDAECVTDDDPYSIAVSHEYS